MPQTAEGVTKQPVDTFGLPELRVLKFPPLIHSLNINGEIPNGPCHRRFMEASQSLGLTLVRVITLRSAEGSGNSDKKSTLKNIVRMRGNSTVTGRPLFSRQSMGELECHPFFRYDETKFKWNLASLGPIPGTAGRDFIGCIEVVASFVEAVFKMVDQFELVRLDLSEFERECSRISQLYKSDRLDDRLMAVELATRLKISRFVTSLLHFTWLDMFQESVCRKRLIQDGQRVWMNHRHPQTGRMMSVGSSPEGFDVEWVSPFSVNGSGVFFWAEW